MKNTAAIWITTAIACILLTACRANKEVADGSSGKAAQVQHDNRIKSFHITQEEGAPFFQQGVPATTALKKYLHLPKNCVIWHSQNDTDAGGYRYEKYNLLYREKYVLTYKFNKEIPRLIPRLIPKLVSIGIPVEGEPIRVVYHKDSFCYANGSYLDCKKPDLSTKITFGEAGELTKNVIWQCIFESDSLKGPYMVETGRILCMNKRNLLDTTPHLAYVCNYRDSGFRICRITDKEKRKFHVDETVYIDAWTGEILSQLSDILYNVRLAEHFPKHEAAVPTENPLDLPWLKAIVERYQSDTANQLEIWECSYLDSLKGYEICLESATQDHLLQSSLVTCMLCNANGEIICSQKENIIENANYFKDPLDYYHKNCQKIGLKQTKKIYQNKTS